MDNLFLTGPLGTQWNIGSWLDKTQPIDYGAAALIRQQLAQTSFVEGARLAYETAAGPRKMSFPIRIRGGAPNLNLIPNPSFEGGSTTGWASFVNGGGTLNDFSASTAWAYGTGKYSAHFKWTQGADTTNRVGEIFTPSGASGIPVAASTAYALSAWLNVIDNSGESNPFFIAVSWFQANGSASGVTASAQLNFTPGLGISRISGTLTSPSDAAYVQIAIGTQSNVNGDVIEWYMDGIQLEQGSAASPFYELDNLTLDQIEASLRQMVRPGGYIDLQPQGVPSAEMVRFDILGGDVAHRNYSIDLQRIAQRPLTVSLLTQPFGYWPTWITLASVASVSLQGNGYVTLPQGSFVGDYPGLLELTINPTVGSSGLVTDAVGWANGARPSFLAGLQGASWSGVAYVASKYFTGANNTVMTGTQTLTTAAGSQPGHWFTAFSYLIASAIEPAYRGRFRAFAQLAAYADAGNHPYTQVMVDAVPGQNLAPALATGMPVATINPSAVYIINCPLLDLGDLTLPPVASGVQRDISLRISMLQASWAGTTLFGMNGLYLLPLDGQAGVITRGLAWPSWNANASTALTRTAAYLRNDVGVVGLSASAPLADLAAFYRGNQPQLGATVQRLDLFGITRMVGATAATYGQDGFPGLGSTSFASVSVRLRPRFQFLKGI